MQVKGEADGKEGPPASGGPQLAVVLGVQPISQHQGWCPYLSPRLLG